MGNRRVLKPWQQDMWCIPKVDHVFRVGPTMVVSCLTTIRDQLVARPELVDREITIEEMPQDREAGYRRYFTPVLAVEDYG